MLIWLRSYLLNEFLSVSCVDIFLLDMAVRPVVRVLMSHSYHLSYYCYVKCRFFHGSSSRSVERN